ncbi:MAG TPA: flagellar hook-basal body complex protein FliE [Ruminiclostridium sp.]|jgi:flagellar hook-basal body complex protein FliE|nr:flagellar hook-basal body complex protein FliE [Clostridiaceae bacterium]HAA24562.1 flagellar hook-basal body complex protein FliE [Ruminiclostridium sp.]
MNVSGLSLLRQDTLVQETRAAGMQAEEQTSFKDIMMKALKDVSGLEKQADSITEDFIAGRTDSIHSVLIAAEKASISLELIVEIRNRVLDAYNEIMRMQV